MIEYSYDIISLEAYTQRNNYDNYVYKINWILTGNDGTYQASEVGQTQLPLSESVENFINFQSIDQGTVVNWIESHTPTKEIQRIKDFLAQQINRHYQEPVVITLDPPWLR